MFWSIFLLVVRGACFFCRYVTLREGGEGEGREGSAAMMANACLLRSADFLQEVVRDGSGRGVSHHHDVTVNWDRFFFHLLTEGRWGRWVVVVVVRTECSTRVSGHARTRMHLIGASAPVPSAGLTSRKPLSLFPTEAGSKHPQCKPHPTPRRGKILRGSPTSPPAREESRGCNIFHRLGVGCPT